MHINIWNPRFSSGDVCMYSPSRLMSGVVSEDDAHCWPWTTLIHSLINTIIDVYQLCERWLLGSGYWLLSSCGWLVARVLFVTLNRRRTVGVSSNAQTHTRLFCLEYCQSASQFSRTELFLLSSGATFVTASVSELDCSMSHANSCIAVHVHLLKWLMWCDHVVLQRLRQQQKRDFLYILEPTYSSNVKRLWSYDLMALNKYMQMGKW